ncbi:hypothetical protein CSQ88_20780 [Iodobacter sp. BJB302]|nr:hypothetical protein CSQ88_20780 [Iodobacter sp. BJB302]
MCAKQSQKDQCLRHVDLGAGVPRDLPFLCGQETKPKKATPRNTKSPALRTIGSAAGGIGSLPRSLAETPPRLFLAPACFKGIFKPYAETVIVMFFRCLLLKKNCLAHMGFHPT